MPYVLADLFTCKHDGAIPMMTDCSYRTETYHRHDVNCPFIPHPHRQSKTFNLIGKLQSKSQCEHEHYDLYYTLQHFLYHLLIYSYFTETLTLMPCFRNVQMAAPYYQQPYFPMF
jgi:hypothetical protein